MGAQYKKEVEVLNGFYADIMCFFNKEEWLSILEDLQKCRSIL